MRVSGPDKSERERLEADTRYNDALTTFDQTVADCRGRSLDGDVTQRVFHALIVFLQQITAFVDTKDRALAAGLSAQLDSIGRARSDIDEIRTRLNLMQRQLKAVGPAVAATTGSPAATSSVPAAEGRDERPGVGQRESSPLAGDVVYVGFEDQFRGPDAVVGAKLAAYVPIFTGATDVVDLGCGRGELLAALAAAGVRACGVDTNVEMVAVARERGLDVQHGDALGFVQARADDSLGGAVATQVIEHLQPGYLVRLLETLARKLRAGAPIVLETINPACWLAFFSSYIRDLTHVRPVHPETLQYLLQATGFERVEIRYRAPVPDEMKMKAINLPAAILASSDATHLAITQLAHAVNANAAILNSLMFTHLDYAAVAYRA